MQAPSLGGVTVPRGNGTTLIRVRRDSSLSDFADKINANPGALVTVLFHLGEMATATQSLDEDTFKLLGAELGYNIEVVSPEEEEKELFPKVRSNTSAEQRTSLGDRMEARKAELGAPTLADKIDLTGEQLTELAKEQEIPGRSKMSTDELRMAVAPQ